MHQLLAKFAVFCTVVMLCGSSLSQVVKCKDAKGKVVYSDVACPANFDAASVNLSGANITEAQARAAQDRTASNSNVESCGMLKNLARQTFASFVDNPNVNRWNTSFQSLQNLANMCPSTDVCGTIKSRIGHAQQRFNEDNKAVRGAHLNSVTSLYASTCNDNGTAKQTDAAKAAPQPVAESSNNGGKFYTNDAFGTLVRSDKCFWTKDTFGVSRRSAGCSK